MPIRRRRGRPPRYRHIGWKSPEARQSFLVYLAIRHGWELIVGYAHPRIETTIEATRLRWSVEPVEIHQSYPYFTNYSYQFAGQQILRDCTEIFSGEYGDGFKVRCDQCRKNVVTAKYGAKPKVGLILCDPCIKLRVAAL